MSIQARAVAARLPAGQRQTILEAKRKVAEHPSLHAYANLKCRCVPCVTAWNLRYRARARAAARLIAAHKAEFDAYLAEELAR